MKKDIKFYLKLFASMFYISAVTFGGGYVIISFMKKKFVDEYKWIDEKEILDITAISQSAPGSIAVNASIMIGYRMAGALGVFISVLGTVLPPLILLSVISMFYKIFIESEIVRAILKGMNAGVAAIVCDAAATLGKDIAKDKSIFSITIMLLSFVAVFFFNIDVKIIIVVCALTGFIRFLYYKYKKGDKENDLS